MIKTEAVKVTCVLERSAIPFAKSVFIDAKADCLSVQSSRNVSMKSTRGFFGLRARTALDERSCDIVRAWVPAEAELPILESIVRRADLAISGRGSVFSESVSLYSGHELDLSLDSGAFADGESVGEPGADASDPAGARSGDRGRRGSALSDSLVGIFSVVQRDQGNTLARSILEMGFSVPNLSFGQGMGLRSKLGLLRVTIPAGKETVLFLVDKEDAQEALVLASETIGLEVPGRGFIYLFPIRQGLADTRIHHNADRYHVASMEQVIAAIDQLSGGSSWRRRSAHLGSASVRGKPRLFGTSRARPNASGKALVNLTLSCADGLAADYLEKAMSQGANGATLSQIQGLSFKKGPEGEREARESSDLILPAEKAQSIMMAIEEMGFFGSEVRGLGEISTVTTSIAYSSRD